MLTLKKSLLGTAFAVALTGCLAPSGGRYSNSPKQPACEIPDDKPAPSPSSTPKKTSYGLDAQTPAGSWAEVQKVMTQHCVSCHANFTNYAQVKAQVAEIVRTTSLKSTDGDFMPRDRAKLSAQDLKVLSLWKQNGTPQNGNGTTTAKPTPTPTPSPTDHKFDYCD